MAGNTVPLVTDVNSLPSPQYYNTGTGVYEYVNGNGGNLYSISAPITPYHTTAVAGYEAAHQVKSSSGQFYAINGTMNNTTNPRWIMVFDSASAPSASAVPLIQIAVVQAVAGQGDTNFGFTPNRPYTLANGLYVASSSTGGTYTASGTADCFYIVEYI